MPEIRPNCKCCNTELPKDARDARICSFDCTFCSDCTTHRLGSICQNWGR